MRKQTVPNEQHAFEPIRFSRGLRHWEAAGQGVGVAVAVVAFALLGETVATSGPLSPLVLLLAALIVGANSLGYVELAAGAFRAGGAYQLIRDQMGSGALSFLAGWALILSSLGVGALLARGFAAQIVTLLEDLFGLTLPMWPWATALVIFLALNNGLGTHEERRSRMTLFLLVALLGFALLAVPQIDLAHYGGAGGGGPARQDWRGGLSLLMAAFVGLEVTASLRERVRQWMKTVPRTLLPTPLVAAGLGALVMAVTIGVVGSEKLAGARNALAQLGSEVVRGAGRPFVLVVGGLILSVAFNSIFRLVVRQIYAMSRDGYWPTALGRLHPRFRTPVRIIGLTIPLLLPLVFLPAGVLSRLAGLLFLLVLMGLNLALSLRPQRTPSAFSLPFHPWVPGLTLAVDILVCLLWGPVYLAWGAGCLGLGMALYLTYARSHQIEAQEGVTVFKPPPEVHTDAYRILVPIANPATAGTLLRLGGALARQQQGEVLALRVVTVPDQVPLEEGRYRAEAGRVLLERAISQAREEQFTIRAMTRIAHSVEQGVLDTAREEKVDLILLGWRGYTRSFGASMGPIIDAVIQEAPCDVTVAKGQEWGQVKKILVPTAGGPHAPIAARLAQVLSDAYEAQVTALYVQLGRATPQQMEENRQRIAQTLEGLDFHHPPERKVVIAESVVEGIVRESEGYDLVLLGASEAGLFDQFLFGSIPQQIAARVPKTAVIVRRYKGKAEFWIRKLLRSLSQIFPRLNVEEQLELRETMSDGARPGINYFVLIILSSIVAALGLLLDSVAVVIGAMLVAPLMSPILAFSLGMVLGDVRLIRLSIEAVLKGVALAIIIGVFVGVLSPFKTVTNEILARAQPTLLDLVVALASGMAGAYAIARKELSAALPGVAIAAALMPPLGAVGLGLVMGMPRVAGGAFLLFLTNIAAINLAGVIIFILLGIRPQTWQVTDQERIRRGLIGFTLLLVIISIPLGIIMGDIIRETSTRQTIQDVLAEHMNARDGELVEFEYHTEGDTLLVVATVRSVNPLDQAVVDPMAAALREQIQRPVRLEVITLPIVRSTER